MTNLVMCDYCKSTSDCRVDCPERECASCGGAGVVLDTTQPISPIKLGVTEIWFRTVACPLGCEAS